jgi:hypothetical protein
MPEKKNNQNKGPRVASKGDNFQSIRHINSIIESRLHQAGILSFEAIASLTPEQIYKKVGRFVGFSIKQILDQNWIGQAAQFAASKEPNASTESEGFILNLFLNAQKIIHSTQILHVNSDEGEKWNGWDSKRVEEFIISHSGIALPKNKSKKRKPAINKKQVAKPEPALLSQVPLKSFESSQTEKVIEDLPQPQRVPNPGIRKIELLANGMTGKLLHNAEPFEVHISLNSNEILQQVTSTKDYTATLFLKKMDSSLRTNLGIQSGELTSENDEMVVFKVPEQNLALGAYRLEAVLKMGNRSETFGSPIQAKTFLQVV